MTVLNASVFQIRKNVIFAVIAFAINIGLVFFSYRLVIHQSGIESLGLWSTLYAWINMIRLGDVGMANASLRFIALCDREHDQVKLSSYLETGIIANAIFYALLGGAGYLILKYYLPQLVAANFLTEASTVLPVMVGGFALMNINSTLLGSLQGLHLGYVNSQLSVVGNVFQILLVTVLVPRLGLQGLAWAQFIQYAASIFVAWFFIRKTLTVAGIFPMRFSKSAFLEMLGFSVKAQIANVANGLFEPFSKLLVGHFGGLQVLGLYELAFKTVALTRNLVVSAVSATLPAMTTLMSTNVVQAKSLYIRLSRRNLQLTSLLLVVVLAASPIISILWMGRVEQTYVIYVGLLCVGFIVNSYAAPAYQLGMASGRMRYNIFTTVLGVVLLAGVGAAVGLAFGGDGVVLVASATIATCGWLVKLLNEKLL